MDTPTSAEITAALDALPAAEAAARAAADPAELLRIGNRREELHQQLHQAQTRDLMRAAEAAWDQATGLMRTAARAATEHAAAEAAIEPTRRKALLEPGTSNEERIETLRAYEDATARAEVLHEQLRTAQDDATQALMAVDAAMDALTSHAGPFWESPQMPLQNRRLKANVIVGEDTVGPAAQLFAESTYGLRNASLTAGTVVPRALAFRLGAHVLGPVQADR